MSPIFNFHLIDGTTAAVVAFILMAGGGGTLALVRHNQRHVRQTDPEAIDLGVARAIEGGVAPSSADHSGLQESTVAAEDTGAARQGGAVEGCVAFGVGGDEGGAGQGDVALGVDASI